MRFGNAKNANPLNIIARSMCFLYAFLYEPNLFVINTFFFFVHECSAWNCNTKVLEREGAFQWEGKLTALLVLS